MPADALPASLGFWLHERRPKPMRADHAHADLEINFLRSGSMRYFFPGGFVELPVGRLALFWGAIPHRSVAASNDARYVVGCIPLAMALRWRLGERLLGRLLGGELVVADEQDDDERLQRWVADLARNDAEIGEIVALELQARLRRLGNAHHVLSGDTAGGDSAVQRMAAFIAAHAAEALDMDRIAASAGLHRKYAGTLFRRHCGMTPWQYLTRLRLAHAQRLLLNEPERSVLAIAEAAGFASQSAFYEAFRKACGCAPAAWRRRMPRCNGS